MTTTRMSDSEIGDFRAPEVIAAAERGDLISLCGSEGYAAAMEKINCNHNIYSCRVCNVQFCQCCDREWPAWESDVWSFGPLDEDGVLIFFGKEGKDMHKHREDEV